MKAKLRNLATFITENRVAVSVGILLFILAFFLRAWRLSSAPDIFADEVTYTVISQNLLNSGNLFWNTGYWFLHPPLHYIIMAPFFGITGMNILSLDAIYASRIVISLISALTILVFYIFINRFGGFKAALITSILLIVEPYTMKFYRMAMIEPLLILLAALCLYFFYNALLANKQRDYIMAGLTLGLALVAKDLAIFLLLVFAIFSFASKRFLKQDFSLKGIRNLFVTAIVVYVPYLVWAFSMDAEGFISSKTTLLRRITGDILLGGYGDPRYRTMLVSDLMETFHIYVFTYILLALSAVFCAYLFWKERSRFSLFLTSFWISMLLFFTVIVRIYNVQFFCYGIIPALLVDGYVFSKLLPLRYPRQYTKKDIKVVIALAFVILSVSYNLYQWYGFYGVGVDNTHQQALEYISVKIPKDETIATYGYLGSLLREQGNKAIQLESFNTLSSIEDLEFAVHYYIISFRLTYFMDQDLLDYIHNNGTIIATFYGHSMRQLDVYYIKSPI